MKVIKSLLLSFILIGFLGIGVKSAKAESEKYTPTIRSYNGVDYAGYLLDSSTVKTFSAKLDLSNSNLEVPIFQFIITPSVRGDGATYSPDFESLVFTLTDSKGKVMTIGFEPRKADAPRYNYINAMAKGENQTLLGEHQKNYLWVSDPEDGAYLSDAYSGISPYTFDGYGADYSWFPFYDKYGNKFEGGCHGVISIYYDIEENALYSDTGYEWVDDDTSEGKEWTLTDKYTLSKSGERRYRIRDFDKNDYLKGSSVITTLWNGFERPDDITLEVSFQKVITENPSILLTTISGKSIVDNYYMETHTKAVKDVEFPVPKPLFFSEGNSYDFETYGGKVKIDDPTGSTVISKRNYTDGMKITPTKTGKYSVSYEIVDPVYSTTRTYSYSFEVIESGGTVLRPNGYERIYAVYELIDAGCYLSNNVQDFLPKVSLNITKDGEEVYTTDDLKDLLYQFESAGNYTFTYRSLDLLGRETVIVKEYTVSEYCLKIKDELSENVILTDANDVVKPASSDYSIINVVTGNKITPTGISIKLSKNGGEFNTYNKKNYIDGEGSYVVKYTYTFSGGTIEALRRFTVFEKLPSISLSSIPENTFLKDGSSLEDTSVYVVALKGSTVSIPSNLFVSDDSFTVNVYDGLDSITDSTSAYNSGTLSLTFNEEGEYCLSARIDENNGLIVTKNIFFIVKEGEINISPVEDQTGTVGHTITLTAPDAKDINGESVTGGVFKVLFNGEEVEIKDNSFIPVNLGSYEVVYTISLLSYSESIKYKYNIIDDESPEITIDNDKNATVGKFFKVDNYTVKDNSNTTLTINIEVTYNGEKVSFYNGGFDATKEGEYEIKIDATDVSGNTTSKTFSVTAIKVEEKGCKSYFGSTGYIGFIALISIFSVALIIKKKKYNKLFS